MTHDPLCPSLSCIDRTCEECCLCDLIARVRDEERESAREALERQAKRVIHIADIQADAWTGLTLTGSLHTFGEPYERNYCDTSCIPSEDR